MPILPPSGGSGDDSFPPLDTSGFGPGPAPGTGYAVDAPPVRRGRGLPIVLGVLAVVLVLCIGGGAAAYFFFAEDPPADRGTPAAVTSQSGVGSAPAGSATPARASATASASPSEEAVSGDLSGYQQGDCLTVDEADDNRVEKARCTDPGAQKVLLRRNGTLDDSVCEATEATFSLSQDAPGSSRDFVLCVGPVD